MATRKVIISCAVTGSIHTPSMSPHLPVTAEQIDEMLAILDRSLGEVLERSE